MTIGEGDFWEGGGRRGIQSGGAQPVILREARTDLAPQGWVDRGEAEFDILTYWRMILKHRLLIGGLFLAAVVLGVVVTLLMKPIYAATTSLQIDREVAKVFNIQNVEPVDQLSNGEEFFQTQYALLKSRSLAERIGTELGLARNDEFFETMGAKPPVAEAKGGAKARDELAAALIQENLKISPVRGSRLVNVTFESPSPTLSAQVANAVAENFIAANLERRFESSSYARDFLQRQLAQTKTRLEDSERQLVAYAAAQQIINVTESGGSDSNANSPSQSLVGANLSALNAAFTAARAERVMAEQRWRQSQGASAMTLPDVLQSPTVQQLSQARAKLRAEYEEKLGIYKADFPAMKQLQAQIQELDRQTNAEAQNIRSSLRVRYEVAAQQERALESQVQQLKGSVLDLRNRSIQYTILQREVDTNRTLYDGLLQRYKEIAVAGGVTSNNISIVDRAEPPTVPSSPKLWLNVIVAAGLGLGLGLLAALLLETADESINTPDDLEAKLGVPVLGSVPALEKGVTPNEMLNDVRSPFSEAYYSIRTSLQFSTPDGVPSSLLLTSTRPSEGKSTSARAVAQNFAHLGMTVLLVDADLRNPSLHRALAADNSKGLSNVLSGSMTLREVVQPAIGPSLDFVACGPLPPNPAELLAGSRVRAFINEATAHYDLVVIDGPPVMGLADAPTLASVVGGTVLVVEAGGTRRSQARATIQRLRVGRARLVGAVLTKFNSKRAASYGSGYQYAYQYEYGSNSPAIKGRADT